MRDPVNKTVGQGSEKVKVRRLSDEEKAARRFRRNIILITSSLIILGLVFFLLAKLG